MMRKTPFLVLLAYLFLLLASCAKEGSNTSISSEISEVLTINTSQINGYIGFGKIYAQQQAPNYDFHTDLLVQKVKYSVKCYKVVYHTTNYNNQSVKVSGIICVPQGLTNPKLAFVLHGTVDYQSKETPQNVPSLLTTSSASNFDVLVGAILSSTGFVTLIPDYIGYGESVSVPHPYCHQQTLAKSSVDMLAAFLNNHSESMGLRVQPSVFITGYSEGGMSALAVHKSLQESPIQYHGTNVSIAETVAGGAPSIISQQMDTILNKQQNLSYLPIYMWVLSAYNTIYQLDLKKEDFFAAQESSKINSFDDFQYATYPSNLSFNPATLFSSSFLNSAQSPSTTYASLRKTFVENDLNGWTPTQKLVLVHGEADTFVHTFQSVQTYQSMKNRNANVELITTPGLNHYGGFIPFLDKVFEGAISLAP